MVNAHYNCFSNLWLNFLILISNNSVSAFIHIPTLENFPKSLVTWPLSLHGWQCSELYGELQSLEEFHSVQFLHEGHVIVIHISTDTNTQFIKMENLHTNNDQTVKPKHNNPNLTCIS